MIDLTKHVLPDSVIVSGEAFRIHTDFTYWVNFSRLIQDKELPLKAFDFLYVDEKPENRGDGFQELVNFFINKRELPRNLDGDAPHEKQFDFFIDADLIYSAFYQQYKIDLTTAHLHWFKFQALLFGLKDTKFTDVLNYRGYDPNDKRDYKKFMRQMHDIWTLETTTAEEKAILERYNSL